MVILYWEIHFLADPPICCVWYARAIYLQKEFKTNVSKSHCSQHISWHQTTNHKQREMQEHSQYSMQEHNMSLSPSHLLFTLFSPAAWHQRASLVHTQEWGKHKPRNTQAQREKRQSMKNMHKPRTSVQASLKFGIWTQLGGERCR